MALGWPLGGGWFLMSEVPLCTRLYTSLHMDLSYTKDAAPKDTDMGRTHAGRTHGGGKQVIHMNRLLRGTHEGLLMTQDRI